MATDQEKAGLRNILTGGVQRMTVGPNGETTSEYFKPDEIRTIQSDLAREDLAAAGQGPARTIIISTNKGIC